MGLRSPAKFYDELRERQILGEKISPTEFQGCEVILHACGQFRLPISWTAYVLATAYHETAGTMQPIGEYGGDNYKRNLYDVTGKDPERARKMGNTEPGDGIRYAGRGFVQLTWKRNYKLLGEKLGVDLVMNPNKALEPGLAAAIMVLGMKEGLFTGVSLDDYLAPNRLGNLEEFTRARKVVNGTDRAADIAGYAAIFQQALVVGEWK